MVSPDDERLLCSFQPVSPFLEGGDHSQQLSVSDVVVSLSRWGLTWEESMGCIFWSSEYPWQHGSHPSIQGIHLRDELFSGFQMGENRGRGEEQLEVGEGSADHTKGDLVEVSCVNEWVVLLPGCSSGWNDGRNWQNPEISAAPSEWTRLATPPHLWSYLALSSPAPALWWNSQMAHGIHIFPF